MNAIYFLCGEGRKKRPQTWSVRETERLFELGERALQSVLNREIVNPYSNTKEKGRRLDKKNLIEILIMKKLRWFGIDYKTIKMILEDIEFLCFLMQKHNYSFASYILGGDEDKGFLLIDGKPVGGNSNKRNMFYLSIDLVESLKQLELILKENKK